MKQWFRTDLLAKGILPVLVVVENRDGARSFLLSKDRVMFSNDDEESTSSSKRGKVASEDAGQALALAGAFASSGALIAGLKLMSDAQVIEHNLADKELYNRTLGPGKEAHGFVYFQFPKGSKLSASYRVVVLLVETGNGDITAFDFKMR